MAATERSGFGVISFGSINGIPAAIKSPHQDKTSMQCLLQEINILSRLKHDNVISLLACNSDPNAPVYLATPVMIYGALRTVLRHNQQIITDEMRVLWALDVARALDYLHSQQPLILHNDLHADNVLVSHHYVAKLCDFGLASQIQRSERKRMSPPPQSRFVNVRWASPERLRGERESVASEMFSYGMLLYELLTGQIPFAKTPLDSCLRFAIVNVHYRPALPSQVHPQLGWLACRLWERNPRRRPSAQQACAFLLSIVQAERLNETSRQWQLQTSVVQQEVSPPPPTERIYLSEKALSPLRYSFDHRSSQEVASILAFIACCHYMRTEHRMMVVTSTAPEERPAGFADETFAIQLNRASIRRQLSELFGTESQAELNHLANELYSTLSSLFYEGNNDLHFSHRFSYYWYERLSIGFYHRNASLPPNGLERHSVSFESLDSSSLNAVRDIFVESFASSYYELNANFPQERTLSEWRTFMAQTVFPSFMDLVGRSQDFHWYACRVRPTLELEAEDDVELEVVRTSKRLRQSRESQAGFLVVQRYTETSDTIIYYLAQFAVSPEYWRLQRPLPNHAHHLVRAETYRLLHQGIAEYMLISLISVLSRSLLQGKRLIVCGYVRNANSKAQSLYRKFGALAPDEEESASTLWPSAIPRPYSNVYNNPAYTFMFYHYGA